MARTSEYSIKVEVDGGKAAAQVFDQIGKAVEGLDKDFDQTGKGARKLDKDLDNLGDEAKKTGREIEGAGDDAKKAERGFNSLAMGVTGLASGLGLVGSAASAAAAPFAALNETITETSRLVNEAALYDVSSSFLNQMTDAAKTAGRELDDVLDVLRDVRERSGEAIAELAKGNEVNTFVEAFGALDVNPEQIKKFTSDSVALFDFFYDKIGESMETGNAQIQFRLQELSSAGYEKIGPVVAAGLRRGITSAEEFRAEMRALGSDFSSFELEEISAIGANFNTLGVVFDNLKKTILVSLSPAIQTITNDLLDMAKSAFGSGGVESFGRKFGEFLTEGYNKAKSFADGISTLLSDGKLGEALTSSAVALGEMVGQGIISGMQSYLVQNLAANLSNLHDRILEWMGASESAMIGSNIAQPISPEQFKRQRDAEDLRIAQSGGRPTGGRYEALGFGSGYDVSGAEQFLGAIAKINTTAREAAEKLRNLTGEIRQVGKDQERADNTSLLAMKQRGELLEFQLSAQFRGYSDTAKANALEIKQFELQRAAARDAMLNTKEIKDGRDLILKTDLDILKTRLKLNNADDAAMAEFEQYAASIQTTSSAMDEVLRQFDERTEQQREQLIQNQHLQADLDTIIEQEKQAATWGANWTQTLTDGISGATTSLGGLIGSLGQLLGIDLRGLGGMFDSLFSGVGGGKGGQIANMVMGGIGSVSSLFGGGKGGGNILGGLFSEGGSLSAVGDLWDSWGSSISGVAGLGLGIYGLARGGGSAASKAGGSIDVATQSIPVAKEIGQAAGVEFAKGAGVNVGAYSAGYGISSLIGGVLAGVLGGSGAEWGSRLSTAGGLTTGLGAGAVMGFNALGGYGASGMAPILGQAGAILGPAGTVLGAAGGGIVIGGKIGDAIGKGNYGNEASVGGMAGGGIGGAVGAAGALMGGVAGGAAAITGGSLAGALMAGLAATGIGLIAAAVLALVFALIGDSLAHTPLLGRQVDDALRATVLDADKFESLQLFKKDTGVGFQNLMTTKKTGQKQGQITGGGAEANVRSGLLAAGFSSNEVDEIMGFGTGYGYLSGGLPFGGAGQLRDAEGEFGMRRKKDDRGAALMYEANYIGSEQMRMVYANAVRTYKEQGKTNAEAMEAANAIVKQHMAELGFDMTGALLAFDDQLFIAQQSLAGKTGAGTNEFGRNEADLARRMGFASDGTMARGMVDAANSWDTLFADSIPKGLAGLDLMLKGMGEAAFLTEEAAVSIAQAAIESGKAFDSKRAQNFLQAWSKSAEIVGASLPAIVASGDVRGGLEDLATQTAQNIGGQLRDAMAVGFADSIDDLMGERGGIAGLLEPLTDLLNHDMKSETSRGKVLTSLPGRIEKVMGSIDDYIPVLQGMANAQAEVNDEISVALGLMTKEEALVSKAVRASSEEEVNDFFIDIIAGPWGRIGYKDTLEKHGKEAADAYWSAVKEHGKVAVDEFLQMIADAQTQEDMYRAIGLSIGDSIAQGMGTALREFALTGDTEALTESLEASVNQAVFNGILTAAMESAPVAGLVSAIAIKQAAVFQMLTESGLYTPDQIAQFMREDAETMIAQGLPAAAAALSFIPDLMEALGISGPSPIGGSPAAPVSPAPSSPAARNDLSYEQLRYEMGAGFIGSLGSYGGLAIEQQNALLNGRSLNVQSTAQQTRDAQLAVQNSSRQLLSQMVQLLREGQITREEFNQLMAERNANPDTFVLEVDGEVIADAVAPRSPSNF